MLPCPFCKKLITFGHIMVNGNWMLKAFCSNCYAMGNPAPSKMEAIIEFWKACSEKEEELQSRFYRGIK